MKIIEFHKRIIKNNKNLRIPQQNQNKITNCKVPCDNNENLGNRRIKRDNY